MPVSTVLLISLLIFLPADSRNYLGLSWCQMRTASAQSDRFGFLIGLRIRVRLTWICVCLMLQSDGQQHSAQHSLGHF